MKATQCPLWVKSRHVRRKKSCPLYPRERTYAVQLGMSALGQKRTFGHSSHKPSLWRIPQLEFD